MERGFLLSLVDGGHKQTVVRHSSTYNKTIISRFTTLHTAYCNFSFFPCSRRLLSYFSHFNIQKAKFQTAEASDVDRPSKSYSRYTIRLPSSSVRSTECIQRNLNTPTAEVPNPPNFPQGPWSVLVRFDNLARQSVICLSLTTRRPASIAQWRRPGISAILLLQPANAQKKNSDVESVFSSGLTHLQSLLSVPYSLVTSEAGQIGWLLI